MGYFIEGHVSADQLRQLANEKPDALRLKKENPSKAHPDPQAKTPLSARTLHIDAQGQEQVWIDNGHLEHDR